MFTIDSKSFVKLVASEKSRSQSSNIPAPPSTRSKIHHLAFSADVHIKLYSNKPACIHFRYYMTHSWRAFSAYQLIAWFTYWRYISRNIHEDRSSANTLLHVPRRLCRNLVQIKPISGACLLYVVVAAQCAGGKKIFIFIALKIHTLKGMRIHF